MDCPSEEELALFASGQESGAVARHVSTCSSCHTILELVRMVDAEPSAVAVRRRSEEPAPGDSIGGYVVLGQLGHGGMGLVLLAYDPVRDRTLAIKLMRARPSSGPDDHGEDARRLLRLKNEFRVARDLHHPNLVRLGELFEDDGQWFFTMELVRGVELLAYVRDEHVPDATTQTGRARPLPEQEPTEPLPAPGAKPRGGRTLAAQRCNVDKLRATAIQLVRALQALHHAGLVHRDVKPANVLVEPDGRVVVVDFGIAIDQADSSHETGRVMGTVSYMAPEQIRGDSVGPAADWYAVGALLFVALTGRPPFVGSQDYVMAAKTMQDGPAPSSVAVNIPADLDRLCERLLSLDPELRPDGAAILRALGADPEPSSTRPTPFVGRDALIAELSAQLEASRGRSLVVTLEGESGIGKTTAAARAIAAWRAVDPKRIVLRGRCHQREPIPYNAIDGVIDDLSRELARLGDVERAHIGGAELAELARLFPTLPAPDAAFASVAATPIAARRRAFAALRELLRRLANRAPVMIVIDDLQWADVDSLSALEALFATPTPPPLVVLATVRRSGSQSWQPPAWMAGAIRHQLTGLGPEAVRAMVDAFERSDVDLARLCGDTSGNPMLLEQWLSLPRGDGAPPAAALDAVIAARTARLSGPAVALLETVVVAGRAVSAAAAGAATGLGADQLDAAVAELSAARFARRDGARPYAIEPFHERIREHVYTALTPERSRALHVKLANALIDTGGAPDAIAAQLALAGLRERAAGYARIAGEAAERALAFERAAASFQLALDGAADSEVATLRVRLADALGNAGRPAQAGDAYLAAAAVARTATERLELRRRGAEQYLIGGYLDRGLAEARALLAETGGGALPRSDAAAVVALASHRVRLAMRPLRWRPRAEAALSQEVLTRLDLHWSLSLGMSSVDSLRGAVFAIRLPVLCLPHGEQLRIARALCAAAVCYAGMGLRRPARRMIEAATRAADSHGSALARFYADLGQLSVDFLVDNDWRATSSRCEQLVALWQAAERGRGWEIDTVEQFGGFAELWLGRFRAVRGRVDALADRAADAGNRFHEVGLRAYFGVLDTLLGDPDACDREVAVALARSSENRSNVHQAYWALRSRTYAAMYRGDVALSAGDLDPAWRRLHGSLLLRVPTVAAEAHAALGAFELTRAVLARDVGARRDHLDAARRSARRLRRNPLVAGKMAFENLAAGIAHAAGDDEEALRLLRVGEATYAAAGMEGQLAATRLQRAKLVGGSDGERLRAQALEWFARERIPDPDRTAALLAPGWHPDRSA
jgi:eukaryotic-like serine/threonine-protein kinase